MTETGSAIHDLACRHGMNLVSCLGRPVRCICCGIEVEESHVIALEHDDYSGLLRPDADRCGPCALALMDAIDDGERQPGPAQVQDK